MERYAISILVLWNRPSYNESIFIRRFIFNGFQEVWICNTAFYPHGGEKISVIGLGTGSFSGSEQQMVQMFDTAIQHGVNLIDIGSIYQEPFFPALAKALDGRRDQVFTQSHFGMVYKDGRCGPSKRLDEIMAQLRRFTPIIRILA